MTSHGTNRYDVSLDILLIPPRPTSQNQWMAASPTVASQREELHLIAEQRILSVVFLLSYLLLKGFGKGLIILWRKALGNLQTYSMHWTRSKLVSWSVRGQARNGSILKLPPSDFPLQIQHQSSSSYCPILKTTTPYWQRLTSHCHSLPPTTAQHGPQITPDPLRTW